MNYRCLAIILLYLALFFGHFASAEVIQAYRKPSETDLQWLLGDAPMLIPNSANPTMIVQAAHLTRDTATLMPQGNPCRPAGLPNPPIPPAPQTVHNRTTTGLAPEECVTSITSTPMDVATSVVQMSGDRLPPPTELPNAPPLAVPLADPTLERLPVVKNEENPLPIPSYTIVDPPHGAGITYSGCDSDTYDVPCACFACIVCGDHRKQEQQCDPCAPLDEDLWMYESPKKPGASIFLAPDMIGSSAWITGYAVGTHDGTDDLTFSLPTMLLSRPNVAEHFNAGVQNRIWADYRHWNNAVSMNDSGDSSSRAVEQFSFGLEKQLLKRSSVELRVPLFYQFASGHKGVDEGAASVELGNVSVFLKQVLIQGSRWTVSGGIGATLPTAEDWHPIAEARLKNNAYYLVSFLGVQWHPNSQTFGHFVVQADLPIEKNELTAGTDRTKVDGQQMLRSGVQLGQWIYRDDQSKRPCRLGVFAEVNYAVVTDGSAYQEVADGTNTIFVNKFSSRKSSLTAAVGMPMVFGKLTCSNSLILPISGSHRPFSAGYNFSLSRQF